MARPRDGRPLATTTLTTDHPRHWCGIGRNPSASADSAPTDRETSNGISIQREISKGTNKILFVPILAIGAFAGIRMAQLERLDWKAVDLERKGKIVRTKELQTHVPALARALKMEWPCNVLRDSFISYRNAIVQSADQVALEAGNSASIIFKHYRELTTPEVAEKWFSILPKDGQWENTLRYDRKKRRQILNGVECQ